MTSVYEQGNGEMVTSLITADNTEANVPSPFNIIVSQEQLRNLAVGIL